MGSQVGVGEVPIVPTLKGFRRKVRNEVEGTEKESSGVMRRGFARAGDESGAAAGRGFKKAFGANANGAADIALKRLNGDVAKASQQLSTARLKDADNAGRVRVAEARLAEAISKTGEDSVRSVAAAEALASARRKLTDSTDQVAAASKRLKDAQQQLRGAEGVPSTLRKNLADLFAPVTALTGAVRGLASKAFGPVLGRAREFGVEMKGRVTSSLQSVGQTVSTKLGPAFEKVSGFLAPFGRSFQGAMGIAQQSVSGLTKAAGAAFSGLVSVASQSFKLIASAAKVVTVGAFAVGAAVTVPVVMEFANAQQSVGGVETLFKESADAVKGYAANAYRDAGLSANQYMEQVTGISASLIQSLGGDTAKAAEVANTAMVDMADNANKMGTDLASIQNAYQGFAKQNYTMLDNLKLGYGGTKEEAQRLLDDASKLPAAMGREFDLSNYADLVEAIHLVQNEMGITGTTQLEAQKTITGSLGMLKGAYSDLLVAMGAAGDESLAFLDLQSRIDAVISSISSVVDNITPVIMSIGSSLRDLGPRLGDLLGGIVATIVEVLPDLIGAGFGIIDGLTTGIVSAAPVLIPAVMTAIEALVSGLATTLPLIVEAGMVLIAGLAAGISEALPRLIPIATQGIRSIVSGFVKNLPMLIAAAIELVKALALGLIEALPELTLAVLELTFGIIDAIVTNLPLLVQAATTIVTALLQGLVQAAPQLAHAALQMVQSLLEGFTGPNLQLMLEAAIQLIDALIVGLTESLPVLAIAAAELMIGLLVAILEVLPELIDAGVQLVVALVDGLATAIPIIAEQMPEIISTIWDALSAVDWWQLGVDIVNGLIAGLGSMLGSLGQAAVDLGKAAWSGFKDFLGISSPSRRFRTGGRDSVKGAKLGFEDEAPSLVDSVTQMAQRAIGAYRTAMAPGEFTVGVGGAQSPATAGATTGGAVVQMTNNFTHEAPDVAIALLGRKVGKAVGGMG